MIQALIGPITQLAGTWLNGKVETKAAETKARVAKSEAEAQIMLYFLFHLYLYLQEIGVEG
jgi:hypothetical protein